MGGCRNRTDWLQGGLVCKLLGEVFCVCDGEDLKDCATLDNKKYLGGGFPIGCDRYLEIGPLGFLSNYLPGILLASMFNEFGVLFLSARKVKRIDYCPGV